VNDAILLPNQHDSPNFTLRKPFERIVDINHITIMNPRAQGAHVIPDELNLIEMLSTSPGGKRRAKLLKLT
jgi:hypothetical protein